jgi:hypothetical protein
MKGTRADDSGIVDAGPTRRFGPRDNFKATISRRSSKSQDSTRERVLTYVDPEGPDLKW